MDNAIAIIPEALIIDGEAQDIFVIGPDTDIEALLDLVCGEDETAQ